MSMLRSLFDRVLSRHVLSAAAVLVCAFVIVPVSRAQNGLWTGGAVTDPKWSNTANWDSSTPPGDGFTAVFDSGSTQNLATVNDFTNKDLAGIQFLAVPGGAPVSIGGKGFTLEGGGIDMTAGTVPDTQALTISLDAGEKITLGTSQNWAMKVATTSNQSLVINAPIDGAVGANLSYNPTTTITASFNTGFIQILGANTYAGDTFVGGPNTTYVLGTTTVLDGGGAIVSGPFGKGTVTNSSFNTAPRYQTTGNVAIGNNMLWGSGFRYETSSAGTLTFNGTITLVGNTTGQINRTINNISNQDIIFNNTITMSQTGDTLVKPFLIQAGGVAGATGKIIINGLIEDGPGAGGTFVSGTIVNKTGTAIAQINSTANTFGGAMQCQNGILEVKSLADAGSPSSIGTGSVVPDIRIGNTTTASTLRYTGSTNVSTNRPLRMFGTTGDAVVENTGAGTVNFTSATFGAPWAGAKFLKLGGTNTGANTIAGVITDNSPVFLTKLDKNGAGTWVLTGASTYTGATTVTAGTLLVSNTSGSGTGTGAVSVASGATLGGTGTISGATTVSGNLAPGASAGTLTFGGGLDVSGAAAGGLKFELNAPAASDKVVLTAGTLNIGTLDFSDFAFTNLGGLTAGTYTLFDTASAITGSIGGTPSGSIGSFTGTLSKNDTLNDVLLTVTSACAPGDYNCDTHIDAADYVSWRMDPPSHGGDPGGYNTWRGAFMTAGSGSGLGASGVPEPTGLVLVVIGLAIGSMRRSR